VIPPKARDSIDAAAGELALVARQLRKLADACEEYGGDDEKSSERPAPLNPQRGLAALASRYLHHRRARDKLFPPSLFADPAWDILLDLYVAHAERRQISVTSACIASAVPQTTALRWVGRLEKERLVVRTADRSDRRRVWLTLAPTTETAISNWLSALAVEWHSRVA
jgi:DNA-binding MarR family transcriptional regulator